MTQPAPTGSVTVTESETTLAVQGFTPDADMHVQIDYIALDGSHMLGIGGYSTVGPDGTGSYTLPLGYTLVEAFSFSHKKFDHADAKVWDDNWQGSSPPAPAH